MRIARDKGPAYGIAAVGVLIPAAMAGGVAAFCVANTDEPFAVRAMQGARAGALAVLFWAVVRLIRPQLAAYRVRGTLRAIGAFIVLLVTPVPQIVVLLAGGGRARTSVVPSTGVVIVSCVLMLRTLLVLAPAAAPSVSLGIISVGGFLLLALTRLPPVLVILCSAAIGLVVR